MSLLYTLFKRTPVRKAYGDFRKALMRDRYDYSQALEITKLMPLLSELPSKIVLDIGAHDGKTYSNSYPLLKRGWKGYLVEPNPANVEAIRSNCEGCDYEVIEAAITAVEANGVRLYLDKVTTKDLRASIKQPDSDAWSKENLSEKAIDVASYMLPELIQKYSIPNDIGLMSLDIEGLDTAVIQTLMDFRPYVLLVEIDFTDYDQAKAKVAYLLDRGYLNVFRIGCNEVFICTDYPVFRTAKVKKFIEDNF